MSEKINIFLLWITGVAFIINVLVIFYLMISTNPCL